VSGSSISHLVLVLSVLVLSGCGALFKVSPLPSRSPSEFAASITLAGLEISAAALLDDDQAIEQFGANLPLAGIVALELRVANRSNKPVRMDHLRFGLRDAAGTRYPRIEPQKALELLMRFYGTGTYLKESYRQTQEGFESVALPIKSSLEPQKEIRGFLFFETGRDAAGLARLMLQITHGNSSLQLPL
jgi:hypothetical protein